MQHGIAKSGVTGFYCTELLNHTFVTLIKGSAETPPPSAIREPLSKIGKQQRI